MNGLANEIVPVDFGDHLRGIKADRIGSEAFDDAALQVSLRDAYREGYMCNEFTGTGMFSACAAFKLSSTADTPSIEANVFETIAQARRSTLNSRYH